MLATDPDSDRIGVALRNKQGEYVLLNGNQTLVLLMSYQLTRWAERGELDGNQYVVKTIVTSQMANAVADHFKVKCYDCLTGFKYIAKIHPARTKARPSISAAAKSRSATLPGITCVTRMPYRPARWLPKPLRGP